MKLNPKQEKFCQLYASDQEFFGNGVQSYIEAYKPDKSSTRWYQNACSRAVELLSSPKVCERINQLLEEGGLNDQFVDKQLAFLVTQHADYKSKLGAIKEYNQLKARITKNVHTTVELPKPLLGGQSVPAHDSDQETA
jgi:hypothetical protein